MIFFFFYFLSFSTFYNTLCSIICFLTVVVLWVWSSWYLTWLLSLKSWTPIVLSLVNSVGPFWSFSFLSLVWFSTCKCIVEGIHLFISLSLASLATVLNITHVMKHLFNKYPFFHPNPVFHIFFFFPAWMYFISQSNQPFSFSLFFSISYPSKRWICCDHGQVLVRHALNGTIQKMTRCDWLTKERSWRRRHIDEFPFPPN